MTLNAKIRGFYDFFGDFRLQDTLQERIALKPIEIDMDKLRMKFSALNMDFDAQGDLHTRASKSGIPVKVAMKWLEID